MFVLEVCLLKTKFRVKEIDVNFLNTTPSFQRVTKVYHFIGCLPTAVTIAMVLDSPLFYIHRGLS